jgi:hypothetical protein
MDLSLSLIRPRPVDRTGRPRFFDLAALWRFVWQAQSCPRKLWIKLVKRFGDGGFFLVLGWLHRVAYFLGSFAKQ